MRRPTFSSRSIDPTEHNPLTVALERARAEGADLIDLTASNPTSVGLSTPPDLLASLSSPAALSYEPDPLGLSIAREAIALHLADQGRAVTADDIVVTASSSESYSYLFHLLADPGDEVLTPAPSYPLFDHLARIAGITTARYPLGHDGSFHLSIDAIEARIGPRTRAVVTVAPNNPTGAYLDEAELSALTALCSARGLALIHDEVFAPYPLCPRPTSVRSIAGDARCLSFALSGLSKACGLPQLKLGWMAIGGPAPLRAEARRRLSMIADTFLSVGTPVQLALPRLFADSAVIRQGIMARIRHNLTTLRRSFDATSTVSCLPVEGGWYAVLRLPRICTDEAWALDLLSRGVLVHPGHFYDFDDEGYLVVSLLPEPTAFERALSIITALVDERCAC